MFAAPSTYMHLSALPFCTDICRVIHKGVISKDKYALRGTSATLVGAKFFCLLSHGQNIHLWTKQRRTEFSRAICLSYFFFPFLLWLLAWGESGGGLNLIILGIFIIL